MYRDRLTITLDHALVEAIDSLIDGETLRNRSQTIEHLLREGIGLHELTTAFLFFREEFDQNHFGAVIQRLLDLGITKFFLCLPSSRLNDIAPLSALIHQASGQPEKITVQTLPADFGSGGALSLQRENLTTPFFLAWIGTPCPLPENLLGVHAFHRLHHATLTQALYAEKADYRFSGLALASPDILPYIPAGIVDIENLIFPQLVKEAKVKGYTYA